MNLYIFPAAASMSNGYGIGVNFAYNKLRPKDDDIVVWYTKLPREKMMYVRNTDVILKKNNFLSFRSVSNILGGKDRTELHYCDLSFLAKYNFDEIHLDESFFYRPMRKMFPDKKMTIRFHNCYSRIHDRQLLLQN